MQLSCLNCYRKHISTSMVYENESHLGYNLHLWLAIGELCAAENEVLFKYPELASTTREYRIKLMTEGVPIPTLELISLATDLERMEKASENASQVINNNG